MNSKEYKQSLNKKVKDMTPEEKKKYGMLRTRESRAKKKGTHKMPDGTVMTGSTHNKDSKPVKKIKINKKIKVGKDGSNKGNLPNKKLKCFNLRAKNGAMYKTCTTPEKNKTPKKQVRGKPRNPRKTPVMKAYSSPEERSKAQRERKKANKK